MERRKLDLYRFRRDRRRQLIPPPKWWYRKALGMRMPGAFFFRGRGGKRFGALDAFAGPVYRESRFQDQHVLRPLRRTGLSSGLPDRRDLQAQG